MINTRIVTSLALTFWLENEAFWCFSHIMFSAALAVGCGSLSGRICCSLGHRMTFGSKKVEKLVSKALLIPYQGIMVL